MPAAKTTLPGLRGDSHVHTEWSWDAPHGAMEQTCERAVELGLPAIAFTEHADFTPWCLPRTPSPLPPFVTAHVDAHGVVRQPALDVDGYLRCVQRCRERFPQLRILTGVELSEPHLHRDATARLLSSGHFERVLGSVHAVPTASGDGYLEATSAYADRPADEVVRDYLAEALRLVTQCEAFSVLAHLDYPVRAWPTAAGRFDAARYEQEYRQVLQALASSGRVLELNTKGGGGKDRLLRWWGEEGGEAISFASDAHAPDHVARGFRDAAALAEAYGFTAAAHPYDIWRRRVVH